MVLTWSFQQGIYNPNKKFVQQQRDIITFVLNHPVPKVIYSAITDVKKHLKDILQQQQYNNSRLGRHIVRQKMMTRAKMRTNNGHMHAHSGCSNQKELNNVAPTDDEDSKDQTQDNAGSCSSVTNHFNESGSVTSSLNDDKLHYHEQTDDDDFEEDTPDDSTSPTENIGHVDDDVHNFEEHLQQEKWSKEINNPHNSKMTVHDAIQLIAMVIPNLDRKQRFIASLQRDFIENASSNIHDNNAEYVYHPALTLELINSHLQNSIDGGASIFTICNETVHDDSCNNFSTWLLVSGETDANFQDAFDESNYRRPTVQTFLNYPGYLDCQPRKGKFPTTQCQNKRVMPMKDLMLISLASSSVYTHLGPHRKNYRSFTGEFIPYPLNWLTDLPNTSILTMNANKSGPQNLFDFSSSIGRDGTLLLKAYKTWGIHYNPQITRTHLQAIHTSDTSDEFFPPNYFTLSNQYFEVHDELEKRRSLYKKALQLAGSNKPRCRRFCKGAFYSKILSNNDDHQHTNFNKINMDGMPLVWDTHKNGALDIDVVVMSQTRETPYTTTQISVRQINKEEHLLSVCNDIGSYHQKNRSPCRTKANDCGKMFGVGTRVHNGKFNNYKTFVDYDPLKSIEMCHLASNILEKYFPHQVIAMRSTERGFGLFHNNHLTYNYDQSVDLGNTSHFDTMDASVGVSVWTELKCDNAGNWTFVFSNVKFFYEGTLYVGLIVKLHHGAAMSWDGRFMRHCSSIPHVNENNEGYFNENNDKHVNGDSVPDRLNHVFGTFWAAKVKPIEKAMEIMVS